MRNSRWRTVLGVILPLGALGGGLLAFSWWRVARCGSLAHHDLASLPHRKVGLVLGGSAKRAGGPENWFCALRLVAAARLCKGGNVDYLLVSGDNHRRPYDEPTWMKEALIERGVPADRIVCDFAGLTTLDSVVRAK